MAKSTDAQVEEKVTIIVAMLLDGRTRPEIAEYALKKWKLQPSTIDDVYLPKARERIKKEGELRLEKDMATLLEMHYRLYAKEMSDKAYTAANRTLDMINRILGTYAPTKSELTGKDGKPISIQDEKAIDLSEWTIEQLIEYRKAARGSD